MQRWPHLATEASSWRSRYQAFATLQKRLLTVNACCWRRNQSNHTQQSYTLFAKEKGTRQIGGQDRQLQASEILRRSLSIGSIFQNQTDKLTDKADADLSNIPIQTELYRHLIDSSAKANDNALLVEVIDRFEKQTGLFAKPSENVNGGKNLALLQNSAAWELYLEALAKVKTDPAVGSAGQRVLAAAQRRQSVLADYKDSTFETTGTASDPSAVNETSPVDRLSRAQLASAVLSRGGTHNVKVAGNSAATPAGASTDSAASAVNASAASNPVQSQNTSGQNAPASPGTTGYASSVRANEPIRVIVEEAKSNLFLRAVRFVLVVSIYTFISLTILSLVLDGSGLMRASTSKAPAQFQPSSISKPVTFADVHGCEEAKAELQEVVDFLKDPEKFSTLGGKLPKGVLLTGPPGTGKTLLARAVAGEAGVSFLFASGSEFDELFVGVGAKRVRELFAAARKAAPCIIFIDELDAIGSKRSPRDAQHMRQTLNQLLTELDGFQQSEGVILLGATNLPNLLDKALTRPGRFDRHVPVPLPDVRGRLQILQHHIKAIKVAPGVNMIQVARGTVGFSGADLENLINQAAVKASRESSEVVDLQHIEWAKDKILMGAERLSAVITPESRRKTAFHEAGHALVALYTDGAMPLHRVTVVPRGNSLGHTMQLPEMDRDSESFLELRARLDVAMGGRVAEEVIYGKDNVTSGAASDIKGATDVANLMVRNYGFSDALGTVDLSDDDKLSTQTMHLIESEVRSLIEGAQSRAMQVLTDRAQELNRLAEALITYESLSLEDVRQVIKGETLNKAVL